jgi:hypothetical protein
LGTDRLALARTAPLNKIYEQVRFLKGQIPQINVTGFPKHGQRQKPQRYGRKADQNVRVGHNYHHDIG